MATRAIFLDRDGTLIEHVPYLASADGVIVLPGVREALSLAMQHGAKLFLFTNQSGVGRGYFTLADVESVNQRMIDLIGLGDDVFTGICIAPEHPDDPPVYRKPCPRYILETLAAHAIAADEAWMIGDAPSDWQAGRNAGVRVAAIVPGHENAKVRDERLVASVPGYPGLLDWLRDTLSDRPPFLTAPDPKDPT